MLDLPPMEDRGVLAWPQQGGMAVLRPASKKMEDMGWCSGSVFLPSSGGGYLSSRKVLSEAVGTSGWKMFVMVLKQCWGGG